MPERVQRRNEVPSHYLHTIFTVCKQAFYNVINQLRNKYFSCRVVRNWTGGIRTHKKSGGVPKIISGIKSEYASYSIRWNPSLSRLSSMTL